MAHFLDEAEQREKQIKKVQATIMASSSDVLKKNEELFLPFHQTLTGYIQKIAALSNESKRPIVEIGFTHLEGEVKYEYYASAYRTFVKKIFLFLTKEKIYLTWRRCYITIIDKPQVVKLTLYEKAVSETNIADVIKKKIKVYVNIKDLNTEVAIWLIDYFGFKISAKEFISKIPHVNHLAEANFS